MRTQKEAEGTAESSNGHRESRRTHSTPMPMPAGCPHTVKEKKKKSAERPQTAQEGLCLQEVWFCLVVLNFFILTWKPELQRKKEGRDLPFTGSLPNGYNG